MDINVGNYNNYFDVGILTAAGSDGASLLEYAENSADPWSGLNNYTAQADNLEVNNSFINKLYNSGASYQARDYWNYFYWWRPDTRKKLRPLYPTYGSSADINSPSNILLFPSATNDPTDCKFYTNSARTVVHTGGFYLNGFCEASCYTPDQEVLFSDGYTPIVDAMDARREDVPLLERLRYICIVSSNMDEFFEVRFADYIEAARQPGVDLDGHGPSLVHPHLPVQRTPFQPQHPRAADDGLGAAGGGARRRTRQPLGCRAGVGHHATDGEQAGGLAGARGGCPAAATKQPARAADRGGLALPGPCQAAAGRLITPPAIRGSSARSVSS